MFFPAAGLRCQRCVRGESSSTPPALCPARRTTLWWRRCCKKVPRPSPKTCGRSWLFLYQSTLHLILLAQVTTRRHFTSPPCSHATTQCRLITADSASWWFLSRAEPGDPCSCLGLEEPDNVWLFFCWLSNKDHVLHKKTHHETDLITVHSSEGREQQQPHHLRVIPIFIYLT